jgi:hypothetical protein
MELLTMNRTELDRLAVLRRYRQDIKAWELSNSL